MTITTIVLAGGHSTRLGREKSLEVIAGISIIQRVLRQVSLLGNEILIVLSQRQAQGDYISCLEAKTVVDLYPKKGALGGIYTGLRLSSCFHNLVVACDMPFLNVPLLHYLIGLSPAFDAVIPRVGDKIEPLHAVYSKNCLDPIERQLGQGNLKVLDFIDSVKVRYVEEDELNRFDPGHLSFFNINTEADLERARMLAEEEGRVEKMNSSGRGR